MAEAGKGPPGRFPKSGPVTVITGVLATKAARGVGGEGEEKARRPASAVPTPHPGLHPGPSSGACPPHPAAGLRPRKCHREAPPSKRRRATPKRQGWPREQRCLLRDGSLARRCALVSPRKPFWCRGGDGPLFLPPGEEGEAQAPGPADGGFCSRERAGLVVRGPVSPQSGFARRTEDPVVRTRRPCLGVSWVSVACLALLEPCFRLTGKWEEGSAGRGLQKTRREGPEGCGRETEPVSRPWV